MAERWQQLSERFAQLSGREKWLIAVCGAVAVLLLGLTLWVEPQLNNYQQLSDRLRSERLELTRIENENRVIEAKLTRDPDAEIDKQLRALTEQSQQLSQELADLVNNLISPSEMALLLEEVLTRGNKLTLVSLSSMPPETLVAGNEVNGAPTEGFYLHPVRIELTGSYFDILDYLNQLESMPKQYFWRNYQYDVEEYPQARLIMEVYTLSSRQEFISG